MGDSLEVLEETYYKSIKGFILENVKVGKRIPKCRI